MTIKQVLAKYHTVEIDLLLSVVLKKSREFLFLNPNYKITKKQFNNLKKLIKRRKNGEPVAYILGYKDFYGLRFKVNENVLVPRPETEVLVERIISVILSQVRNPNTKILKQIQDDQTLRILDVGTGSGCIAVTLAKQFSIYNFQFIITASDISSSALKVAKANAKVHKVKINFIQSDLLKNIKFTPNVIIANLPYGWKEWKNNTTTETVGLKFEPKEALYTKESGLFEIRRLLEQISKLKIYPRVVYLEFDPRQKVLLKKIIKKILPSAKTEFKKDYANKWRFVEIIL